MITWVTVPLAKQIILSTINYVYQIVYQMILAKVLDVSQGAAQFCYTVWNAKVTPIAL
jgi:hypothetical protein